MSKAQVDTKLRSEGRCRLCERTRDVRPLTRHRVVPGAFGGRYIAVNCVPLCRPCHDLVDHKDHRVRHPARRMLRASLWPVEIAHAKEYSGVVRVSRDVVLAELARRWYFDDAYPVPPRELVLQRRRPSNVAV